MNNYETVQNLPVGTIFKFDDGYPWKRTDIGVEDLLLPDIGPVEIPRIWTNYHYQITTLPDWTPEDEDGLAVIFNDIVEQEHD